MENKELKEWLKAKIEEGKKTGSDEVKFYERLLVEHKAVEIESEKFVILDEVESAITLPQIEEYHKGMNPKDLYNHWLDGSAEWYKPLTQEEFDLMVECYYPDYGK